MEIETTQLIDARGMPCPGPLMSLIGAIRQGAVGDVIEIRSSDLGSRTDIPAWVAKAGHDMLTMTEEGDDTTFVVRRVR